MTITAVDQEALIRMASDAVRAHGIDDDAINSDTIYDAVHPEIFGKAVNAAQFTDYTAAEISDLLGEAISTTYWRMVDEANGLV